MIIGRASVNHTFLSPFVCGHVFVYVGILPHVKIVDGKLTGEVIGPIVDAQRKADLLVSIAKREGIPQTQIVAVGDGANDLLMLSRAGLGVAFNAKPKVQQVAKYRLNQPSLSTLLYVMGFTHSQIASLLRYDDSNKLDSMK